LKAYVEVLAGVVRIGEDCDEYGKPYDLAVAFSVDGSVATVKALTAPDGGLKRGHVKACVAALRALGLEAKWMRMK
jgi:hypothetical protein